MVYCHECGSEITEKDAFCPFCGITLQPIDVGGNEDVDSTNDEMSVDDVKASEELTPADLLDDPEDNDNDMAETIVVSADAQTKEDSETKEDSGYLNISSLKDKEEVPNENVEPSKDDSLESAIESKFEEFENEKNNEVVSDINIEENQDDIEELLSDDEEENIKESVESKNYQSIADLEKTEQTSQNVEEIASDEKAVKAVTETIDEIKEDDSNELKSNNLETSETKVEPKREIYNYDDESFETSDASTENEKEISDESESDLNLEESSEPQFDLQTDVTDHVEAAAVTPIKNYDEPIKTSDEIKSVDDSEIDDALSAIDSKANAWKDNEVSSVDETKTSDEEGELNKEIEETPVSLDSPHAVDEEKIIEPEIEIETSDDVKSAESEVITPANNIVEDSEVEVGSNTELEDQTPVVEEISDEPIKVGEESIKVIDEDTKIDDSVSEDTTGVKKSQTAPNIGLTDTDGSNKSKLKPLDEGVILNGRYEIVRKIGGGGMGAVYLANDKNLGGVLRAVKEMVQSYIEEEQQEKAIQDFKRESMLLTSLDHRSIPTIYDYFYDEKEARFYLVMKYISGGDLAARLRAAPDGKIDEIEVAEWAYQIADVLDYLHSRNPPIVYRDLKPANIMIDGNTNRVMLIDFGIARWINKEEKGVTAVGTMGYAPPELFSGNVEPSSDIYSLGSTMFHLLTGADPQNNPLLIFDFQKHPRPRQINPRLSDQMERILMKAVEYNAEKRFNSAAEMREVLREHVDNLKAGRVSFGIKESPQPIALSDQPVFCGFCGQKIVATDMFCAFCGAKQPLAQPGVQSQEYNLSQNTAKLFIEGTSELDYPAFELVKSDNLVGRRDPMSNIFPEVDLSKYDPQTKISRKHARIWREGDKFLIEDLGSSNGTYLLPAMSEKVKLNPHQSKVLENGDKLLLGDTTLQFMLA